MTRASLLRLLVCLSLAKSARADTPPTGLHILTASHSLHVWMPGLLIEVAKNPRDHVKAIAAYCHFAVIYGRSPIGLPIPAAITKLPEAEKLNALLQKLAWDAVTQHPLSGVKAKWARLV